MLPSAFLIGIPTDKKLKFVIFQFAFEISVRKTNGIGKTLEPRPKIKSEKQPALPIIHAATHA